jgi:hypothetical protein
LLGSGSEDLKEMSVLAPFVAALEAEFAFLVDKYGFEQLRGEHYGHEFVVAFRRYPVIVLRVTYERFSTPWITVSVKEGALDERLSNAPLRLLAKKRVPGWQEPFMEEGAYTEDGFRDFFRQYRLLLENDFQDLLTVGLTRATPDATDKTDSVDEEPAEPAGDTNRRARLWGAAIAVTAFLVILFEFRYFGVHDLPDAPDSVRAGWGMLFLLGLPTVAFVAGMIQALSGIDIRDYGPVFASKPLLQRLAIALGAIALSLLATGLAVALL